MMSFKEAQENLGRIVRVIKKGKSGLVLADTATMVMEVVLLDKKFSTPGLLYCIITPKGYKIHVWDGSEIDTQIIVLETIAPGKLNHFQAEAQLKNQRVYVYRPERRPADGVAVYERLIDETFTVREITGSIMEDDMPVDVAYYIKYTHKSKGNKEIMVWWHEVDSAMSMAIIEPANIVHLPYGQAKQCLFTKEIRVGLIRGIVEAIYLGPPDGLN